MDNQETKNYSEDELKEILDKVNNFLASIFDKYESSSNDDNSVNILKVNEIRDFIYDNELSGLNLDIFDLSECERSVLEHMLKVTFFRSAKEIVYQPSVPDGFRKVSELKEEEIIFKEYWELVPNTCSACGSEIVSNANLTIIKCSNMRCKHNLASSLRKIAVKESIPGLGGKTCYAYFDNGRLKSVLDVFENPDSKVINALERLKLRKREYSEWVKLLSLPGIETQANYLFKGINCYDDYVKELNKHGGLFNFCLGRLGGEGKQANNIAQVLEAYDYELQRIEDLFPIGVEAERIIDIAMTGNIYFSLPGYGKFTKQKFLDFINNIYPEYISFRKTESVNKAVMVISDYASGSSKYVAAKSQGKLITSENLVRSMLNTNNFIELFFPDDFEERLTKLKSENRVYCIDEEEKSEEETSNEEV